MTPFRQFLSTLRQRLPAPRRLLLSSRAPLSKPGAALLPAQLVIARGFCRFSRFDLKNIPVKRRLQALQLQLRQWSPFAQPEFAIVLESDAALVWCWDAAWLSARRAELPAAWQNAEAIPETVLQAPHTDGMRLLTCLDGVEAQYWKQGELHGSRWWPQTPELQDYLGFCREAGSPLPVSAQLPAVQQPVVSIQPWLPVITSTGLSQSHHRLEQWFYALLFLCLVLPYGWYSLREQQLNRGLNQIRSDMAQLTGQANSLVQARETALHAVDEIAARQRLDPYPGQLDLMTAVAEALPSDSTIREWEFQENKLRIVIAGGLETPSRADITKNLIASGYFAEVQNLLARDTKALSFRMTVLPRKGVTMTTDNPAGGKE